MHKPIDVEGFLNDNCGLIYKIVNKYPDTYREDLVQEGYYSMLQAINKYDNKRGMKLETYSYDWIRGNVSKKYNQLMKIPYTLEYNDEITELAYNLNDIDDNIDNRRLCLDIIKRSDLTDLEYNILKYIYGLDGHDALHYDEIIKILNIKYSTLRYTKRKALRKLRHTLGKN